MFLHNDMLFFLWKPTMPFDTLSHRLETRLKMRHYVLLVAMDQHRSVTRVAQQLALTQPTVTRVLADIEEIFMTPLFLRTRRGLEPTPAGQVVIARARLAVRDNQELQQELLAVQGGRQGRLRLGLIPYVSSPTLDAVWHHLFAIKPRLTLLAHEDTTHNLIAGLRGRTLDCAVCRFSHESTDDDLVQALLYHQRPHLVVAKGMARLFARHRPPDIARLSEMDWIFPPPDTPIRHIIDNIFASAGRTVPIPMMEAVAARSIASALALLPRGITILPNDIAQAVALSGAVDVLPEALPWELPPVGLAWLKNSPKAGLAAELARHVMAAGQHSGH